MTIYGLKNTSMHVYIVVFTRTECYVLVCIFRIFIRNVKDCIFGTSLNLNIHGRAIDSELVGIPSLWQLLLISQNCKMFSENGQDSVKPETSNFLIANSVQHFETENDINVHGLNFPSAGSLIPLYV